MPRCTDKPVISGQKVPKSKATTANVRNPCSKVGPHAAKVQHGVLVPNASKKHRPLPIVSNVNTHSHVKSIRLIKHFFFIFSQNQKKITVKAGNAAVDKTVVPPKKPVISELDRSRFEFRPALIANRHASRPTECALQKQPSVNQQHPNRSSVGPHAAKVQHGVLAPNASRKHRPLPIVPNVNTLSHVKSIRLIVLFLIFSQNQKKTIVRAGNAAVDKTVPPPKKPVISELDRSRFGFRPALVANRHASRPTECALQKRPSVSQQHPMTLYR